MNDPKQDKALVHVQPELRLMKLQIGHLTTELYELERQVSDLILEE